MKTKQGQEGQLPHNDSELLKKHVSLIQETRRVYGLGDKAGDLITKTRENWKQALGDDPNAWFWAKNFFFLAAVNGSFESRLFFLLFDEFTAKRIAGHAEEAREIANLVGLRPARYNRDELGKLIAAYDESLGMPEGDDLLGFARRADARFGNRLRSWLDQSYERRGGDRHERAAKTQTAITEALDEGEGVAGEAEPDPRVELSAALGAARSRKTAAIASEDFAAAAAAKEEIAQLESQLAALETKEEADEPTTPPLPVPTTQMAELVAVAAATTLPIPNPSVTVVTTTTPPPAATDDGGVDFLREVENSRLSKGVKQAILTSFAGGDEQGARRRFKTLSALLK